jgi:hypothetical protein
MKLLKHYLQSPLLPLMGGTVLLFILGLLVGFVWPAPQPSVPITQAQVPTAASTATSPPQPTATPFPTPTVDPTRAAVQALQQVAPDAPVYLGEPTEVLTNPTRIPPDYTYRRFDDGDITRMVITNTVTGEVTPLGNDQGSSYFYGMTDRYVLWAFLCHEPGCDPENNPPLPSDFYLYDLETRTNRVFTAANRNGGLSVAQLSGDWIAFARPENLSTVHLYAVNVRTGEDVLITDNITFPGREAPYVATRTRGVFNIAKASVVWTEQENLYRYDLTTGMSETLNVPAILTPPRDTVLYDRDPAPRRLHTSERAVVWQSQSEWWGYDFVTKHYLPIPPIRRMSADGTQPKVYYPWSVTVVEDTVYMRVTADTPAGREEFLTFSAPLVRPGLAQADGEHTQVYLPLVSNNGR